MPFKNDNNLSWPVEARRICLHCVRDHRRRRPHRVAGVIDIYLSNVI